MKRETFETAQSIYFKLQDVNTFIDEINANKPDHRNAMPLNLSYSDDDEFQLLRKANLKYLNARKKSLEKEFENLK